ncbi:hypothetical protein BDK88_2615 [Natrinema hispanicum]|uniref:DUF7974 domain-containing protein n=1 Tax=Natrinema hispanicum TaxID=392421 RepID=A0A482Y6R8_9EURY|nr:hypothetical protein [Natrinema hispanicum]RZV08543.1 hypothetical protein BDK88_2615 [Natrinema hispanicum]
MTRDARLRERATDERTRTIDWAALSHAVTPQALRYPAIDVGVSTDKRRYEPGDPVDITITFRNRLPIPIRIRTDSPNYWYWTVDGLRSASQVPRAVPDRPAAFSFTRRERKRFQRQWHQRMQVSEDEWQPVDPGTYTLAVSLTRSDAAARGLIDHTTIEIVD